MFTMQGLIADLDIWGLEGDRAESPSGMSVVSVFWRSSNVTSSLLPSKYKYAKLQKKGDRPLAT